MKFVLIIFTLLVLAVACAFALGYWVERPMALEAPREITVAPGDGTREIAARLDSAGVIRSRRAFRWLAKWKGIDRHLRPGRYRFEGTVRLSDVLQQLNEGRIVTVMVTIPEGWTLARIAPHLTRELRLPPDALAALMSDTTIVAEWAPGAASLEGYLWPETYQFYWGVKPREVLTRLLQSGREQYNDTLAARAAALGWTRHQVLTLASLIEAEAADGNERGMISGVFHNRLREGWLLQCDPTVIYAMGGLPPDRLLSRQDLDFESPYNTYLHPGLPPGPICNPGLASIRAALYPDSTDAMYFVADGQGAHVFSRTLEQHNAANSRVKREQRQRR
jgi:UPF0755 protein